MAPSVFLAYASSSTRIPSAEELVELLAVSRVNNERVGVTGMLLHRGGNFLQALEGSEQAVRGTMRRIERDGRHSAISVLLEEPSHERLFPDWSMAFEEGSKLDPAAHPGLSDYLASAGRHAAKPDASDHHVFEFFRSFRQHLR